VRATVHGEAAWTQERFAAQAAEKLLLSHFLLGPLFFVVYKPNEHINGQLKCLRLTFSNTLGRVICGSNPYVFRRNQAFDHSNESYRAVIPCGTVYCAAKVVLTFKSMEKPKYVTIQMKALHSPFM